MSIVGGTKSRGLPSTCPRRDTLRMKLAIKEPEIGPAPVRPAPQTAWRAIGWFGLLLGVVGLGDILVNWYPLGLGSPEWEFGTIGTTLGQLPLLTMGVAALLASFLARGTRWGVMTMGIVLLVLALAVLALYTVFLLDVPLALKATARSPVGLGIRRGIARASVMAVGFSVGYLAAAVVSLRSLRRRAEV